jgi:hypothetical protein
MGTNIFMAEFACEKDKTRVLDGSPWTVGKHGVILNEFDPNLPPAEFRFEEITLWARIMSLPFGLMNDKRGKSLAERVGVVKKMEVDDKGRAWGEFLRVRLTIKITEPLMRCVSVFSQKRQTTDYYTVMYERLPTFCFSCGLIGHSSLGCATPAERDADGFLPYHGPRLCVPDERKKQAGANSGQGSFSTGQSSWPGTGHHGPSSQTNASARPHGKHNTGEVNPPVKPKKQRTRNAKSNVAGKETALAQGGGTKISGQKRKVYVPKSQTVQGVGTELAAVPPGTGKELALMSVPIPAVEEADSGTDSNKKHKMDNREVSSGSADQAAAALQSRRTQ